MSDRSGTRLWHKHYNHGIRADFVPDETTWTKMMSDAFDQFADQTFIEYYGTSYTYAQIRGLAARVAAAPVSPRRDGRYHGDPFILCDPMLKTLKALFEDQIAQYVSADDPRDALPLAVAALLLEISRADQDVDDAERHAVCEAVARICDTSADELEVAVARRREHRGRMILHEGPRDHSIPRVATRE